MGVSRRAFHIFSEVEFASKWLQSEWDGVLRRYLVARHRVGTEIDRLVPTRESKNPSASSCVAYGPESHSFSPSVVPNSQSIQCGVVSHLASEGRRIQFCRLRVKVHGTSTKNPTRTSKWRPISHDNSH